MSSVCRSLGFALSVLGFLAGCENGGHFTLLGYTTQPTFDTDIKTIYVPIAKNETNTRDIEYDLTKAVVRELSFNSPYHVTSDRRRADTELVMKITKRNKTSILINQRGLPRDIQIGMIIEVVWRDLRPGRVGDILSNRKRFDPSEKPLPGELPATAPKADAVLVTPNALYVPELGGSTRSAEQEAINQAAMQIIQMMEKWH